jgi:hypothetical protein
MAKLIVVRPKSKETLRKDTLRKEFEVALFEQAPYSSLLEPTLFRVFQVSQIAFLMLGCSRRQFSAGGSVVMGIACVQGCQM